MTSTALQQLHSALDQRLCQDLKAAFSHQDETAYLSFFVPDAEVVFEQHGQDMSGKGGAGKTVRVFTGSWFGAVLRRCLPAALMIKIVFRRFNKRRYSHSEMTLMGVRYAEGNTEDVAQALVEIERFDLDGHRYEVTMAAYTMRKLTDWQIESVMLFDELDSPPSTLESDAFWRPATDNSDQ